MKIMIISDIHGNIYDLKKILNIYKNENCNKLIILGDLFNYNFDINREEIINILNNYKNNIEYVRGNGDVNLNGILFDIPCIKRVVINNIKFTLTHGHLYNINQLLKEESDIILTGHTHISNIEKINNKIFINPGSISKSRKGKNSFAILDDKIITIRDLDNNIIKKSF